jgi:hypothetical protein
LERYVIQISTTERSNAVNGIALTIVLKLAV